MPVTDFYTMNGEIVAETTTGSLRLDYIQDALGNVIAMVDQTGTVQSTASYKPSGDILSSNAGSLFGGSFSPPWFP